MNIRSLVLRAAFAAAVLGFAYGLSVGARRFDDAFSSHTEAAPTVTLLPFVGLPLVYLLSRP
jgi:hypothetical protein